MKIKYIFLILLIIIMLGCSKQETQTTTETIQNVEETSGTLKGVSLSPRSFEQEDFVGFFTKARQAGDIVMWAGDWYELSLESGGPKVVAGLASTYDYIPLIEVSFYSQDTGELRRPLNKENKILYKESILSFVEKYKPRYIGIGIEINILYEKKPRDFNDFVEFYNEVYDEIKRKSPNTKVYTIFQLEKMKGYALWVNEPPKEEKEQWLLIEKFKSDIVVFSTYPGLVFKSPSEIPAGYYNDIKSKVSKPIAFSEIGWHSAASPPGWESSEEEQAEFVTTFFDLTKELNAEFLIWSFLYDPKVIEPFDSMGLISSDGKERLAWQKWASY